MSGPNIHNHKCGQLEVWFIANRDIDPSEQLRVAFHSFGGAADWVCGDDGERVDVPCEKCGRTAVTTGYTEAVHFLCHECHRDGDYTSTPGPRVLLGTAGELISRQPRPARPIDRP